MFMNDFSNGKYIKNMGVYHGFEKNETATMFFLKKPSLVNITVLAWTQTCYFPVCRILF